MRARFMQIRGIKRGKTIELTENIAVPDGSEMILEISPPIPPTAEEHWQQLCQLFGAWSNQPDLDATLTAIAQQRHQNHGRELLNLD
ncbi:MAG: hypothetical protein P5678_17090 [Limnospira sp. PMC 1240.20]|uniref:hypothetical protein n=2 Tax=unclassified Limnospira TaxID=2642885 RepID=UPI0028E0C0A2|nr:MULTISPECIES: hypothetical protein [unclassified Limnospira]MDT9204824.1 hypothetical protein [Limnospira sp. PMC 1243.20]MDT9209875.1 hypothetical protein [Limnospira sp. PMC 1252.20]MDT9281381.1 hypothetical protein [Limnospira sp. PMC 1293.21]MDT9220271.1 hypothetical protein [Limnospira sp. PMC 1240.20]MDT9260899.1 hypothetical protein [Limnospira sp. PMC 1236.20]